jgi:hypothetical protein
MENCLRAAALVAIRATIGAMMKIGRLSGVGVGGIGECLEIVGVEIVLDLME